MHVVAVVVEEWWAAWRMHVFVCVCVFVFICADMHAYIYNERCTARSLLFARCCAISCLCAAPFRGEKD
jgi:hypothetical protein